MGKNYREIVSVVDSELDEIDKIISEGISYPTEDLKHFLFSSGKKIRPAIALLFLKMFGCDIDNRQLNLLSGVELAHNASLIHDDVIDMSKVRRNIPTFEAKFDAKTAVMTGDFLLSLAFKKLLQMSDREILDDFVDTFSLMSQGEIGQYFEKFRIPTLEHYIEKTVAKTAKLFEIALKSSAKIANQGRDLWADFGLNFGIAFQIKNDLDNFNLDKSDVKNGVYTAPVIYSGSADVTSDGIHKTELLINNYICKLKDILYKCPENEYRQALFDILGIYENG